MKHPNTKIIRKNLLAFFITWLQLLNLDVSHAIAATQPPKASQCLETLALKQPPSSPSHKNHDPYWDLGEHKIGRLNIPVFELKEYKKSFAFGLTDNPYHAVEITHERGSYLLINTSKISPQSQIYQLVQEYLFEFIPKAYRSFDGERSIDESTISSINAATRQIMNKLTLFISMDRNNEINGGMGFITSLNVYEPLPLETEIFDLIRKGFIQSITVEDVLSFSRHSNHRIEGVRTYAKSASTLKSLVYLSGKLLKNEKQKYPETAILMALISQKTYNLYESVLKLHFTKVLKLKGFSGNDKIDILGEIDINQIPEDY